MARADDRFLSMLPLSHMFERTGGYYLPLSLGAKVVFARGVAQLADDLATQAPTVIFAVPRIFERFQARIEQTLAGVAGEARAVRRSASRAAFASRTGRRTRARSRCSCRRCARWSRSRSSRGWAGGCASPSSAARRSIRRSRARSSGWGSTLLQGYGMTEASPVDLGQPRSTTTCRSRSGPPLPGVEVQVLADAANCWSAAPT